MGKPRKNTKSNSKKTKQEKYNADNEIIIGVTTINNDKRVENKKTTRKNNVKKRTNYKNKNNIEDIPKEKIIKKE